MRQLSQTLNECETALSGRPQGERSTVQTYSLPASHQEVTDNETPDDPVPDQFEVSDFLPDEDRLLAPLGDFAAVPDNDVLKFVLIKRRIGSVSTPWTIPDQTEFEHLINEATQVALNNDCLAPFAWLTQSGATSHYLQVVVLPWSDSVRLSAPSTLTSLASSMRLTSGKVSYKSTRSLFFFLLVFPSALTLGT